MDDSTINNLREALKYSPDNIPLKIHLAESLLALNRFEEAEKEYKELLAMQDNSAIRLGLATTYFKQKQYATCSVILEDSLKLYPDNVNLLVLYAKTLLKEDMHAQARET